MSMDEEQEGAELVVDALQKAVEASRGPLSQIQEGARLMTDYLSKQTGAVAAEQRRIKDKMQDGSRLTKHRFTV